MRIAVDLDGVLADLQTPFLRTAERLYPGLDVKAPGTTGGTAGAVDGAAEASEVDETAQARPVPALTRRQTDAVWQEIVETENFWDTLDEIEPGAIAALAGLADERGWEVLFITSRPTTAGATVQRQSQRWLERHGFPLPSLWVAHGSRGKMADALAVDIVLDDRVNNCLDVVLESKAGALLIWRDGADPVPASTNRLGIAVVPTVAAAVQAIMQAEREATGESGVVERLLKLFGLKAKASSQLLR